MFHYHAYNLGISSFLPLPELPTSAGAGLDVSIRLGRLAWSPAIPARKNEPFFESVGDRAYLAWEPLGKYSVQAGSEVVVDPTKEVDESLLRQPLLGVVMAILHHQRGRLVFHASAVEIDDGAVIFLGNKVSGKSTMAAALCNTGNRLLADDVVVIEFDRNGQAYVLPGYPQVKLYPDTISQLGQDPDALPPLAPGLMKRACQMTDRFSEKALPLRRVYVLASDAQTAVRHLQPQDALLWLMSNSYVARFGKQLLSSDSASRHLSQCIDLVRRVPVRCLERPRALELLPAVVELIEADSRTRADVVPVEMAVDQPSRHYASQASESSKIA